jgi:triphosphatase
MGLEIELKLGVAPSDLGKVANLPWLSEISTGPAKSEKLVTVYFDTAKFKLRQYGLALRVRHAGNDRLQTIKVFKKGGRGAFGRDEWEEKIAGDTPTDGPGKHRLFRGSPRDRCEVLPYTRRSADLYAVRCGALF